MIDGHPTTCGCPGCASASGDAAAGTTGSGSADAAALGGTLPDVVESTDAAASTATAYTLAVGETAQGQLGSAGDHDFYAVNLVAGQTYTFAMTGTGTDNVIDTYLRLYASNGTTLLAQNDDGLPGSNSVITFTAAASGTYYLDVGSFNNFYAGQYGVSVTLGNRASLDLRMGAGVIDTDYSWSATPGTGATVTYGFRQTSNGDSPNFSQLTAAEITAVKLALQFWSDVAGVSFTEVNPGGYTNNASILFTNYSANDGAGAYAYYPGSPSASSDAGDVWFNTRSVSTVSLPFGGYSFFTVMHEIGHALGLSHPGLYNAAPGVSITYANNAQFIQDTTQYSVMSYFDESYTGASHATYADTPMLLDVYALQQIYGANLATRTGDTVYGFGSNAGSVFDFAINTTPAVCIWDGGGTDTLDCSGFGQTQTISLVEGTFSSIGGLLGNVSIALGVAIENAIGGSGNDAIYLAAGSIDNLINGSGGTDTVHVTYVYGGNYLVSGAAADLTMTGAEGTDTFENVELFVFSDGTQVSAGDLVLGVAPSPDLTASNVVVSDSTPAAGQLVTVNFQIGNSGYGASGAAFLAGVYLSTDASIGTGDALLGEKLVAALGAGSSSAESLDVAMPDWLAIGATYYVGVIADYDDAISDESSNANNASGGVAVVVPIPALFTESADTVVLPVAGKAWHALGGDDIVTGTSGVDIIYGDAGNDTLAGGAGADLLFGGTGVDTVSYQGSAVGVTVNLSLKSKVAQGGAGDAAGDKLDTFEGVIGSQQGDSIAGSKGGDSLSGLGGNDAIYGGNGNDVLDGGEGDDTLNGGKNNDTIYGGEGDDTLIGDAGNDSLLGGGGNDFLNGGKNNDTLDGGEGNDALLGDAGNDILIGGAGDDILTGGKNNDVFVFSKDFGHDRITDFAAGPKVVDVIQFDSAVFASFGDVVAASQQVGTDVVITTVDGDTLTLQNLQLALLHANDFLIK